MLNLLNLLKLLKQTLMEEIQMLEEAIELERMKGEDSFSKQQAVIAELLAKGLS